MNRGLKRPSLPCLCPNAGPRRTFAFTWGGVHGNRGKKEPACNHTNDTQTVRTRLSSLMHTFLPLDQKVPMGGCGHCDPCPPVRQGLWFCVPCVPLARETQKARARIVCPLAQKPGQQPGAPALRSLLRRVAARCGAPRYVSSLRPGALLLPAQ